MSGLFLQAAISFYLNKFKSNGPDFIKNRLLFEFVKDQGIAGKKQAGKNIR